VANANVPASPQQIIADARQRLLTIDHAIVSRNALSNANLSLKILSSNSSQSKDGIQSVPWIIPAASRRCGDSPGSS
jgi:hypothetical protein